MSDLSSDQVTYGRFKEATGAYFDQFSCTVDTRFNVVAFTDNSGADVVLLDVQEARDLRDWLNRVIPVESCRKFIDLSNGNPSGVPFARCVRSAGHTGECSHE